MEGYSVLMSVYNREKPRYLRESIESVFAQSLQPEEFVLVCDGPLTPELDDVIEDYNRTYPQIMKVVRHERNSGLGHALNSGLRHCSCMYVARMDSDDVAMSHRCQRQMEVFATMQVDIVGGAIREFDGTVSNVIADRILPETQEEILRFARRRNPFNHPAVMFRKDKVFEVGGYEDYPYFEDYDLWVRMLMAGAHGYNIQEPILYMRGGDDMYNRRGGLAYVRHMLHFKWHLYKIGYVGWRDYLVSVLPHVIVGLVPNSIRRIFYKNVLRKKQV